MSHLSLILSVDSDDCKQWQLMKNEERFKHLNKMYEITRFTEFKKDFIAHIKWMKEKINIYKFCKFWSKLDEQYNVQYQFFTARMLYIHISSKFQFFVYNKYNPSLFLRLIDIKATFTILLDRFIKTNTSYRTSYCWIHIYHRIFKPVFPKTTTEKAGISAISHVHHTRARTCNKERNND